MRRGAVLLPLLVAFVATACRARLPVDAIEPRPAASPVAERPSAPRPSWERTMRTLGHGEARSQPFEFQLSPDRLRDVIRYRPYQPGPGGLLGFINTVPVCLPHQHGR